MESKFLERSKYADLPPQVIDVMTIENELFQNCLTDNTIFGNSEKDYLMRKKFPVPLSLSYEDTKIPRVINWN